MANEKTQRDQAIGAIDEYLKAAEICIGTLKPDRGILGYPAALLLLCATDAIGQGALRDERGHTRLDVLANPIFGPLLSEDQAKNVTYWYRHLLAHNATIAHGVYLEPDAQGAAFEFDTKNAPVLIRLGKLYQIVTSVWGQVKDGDFDPPKGHKSPPDPNALPRGFVSSLSPAASGVVKVRQT